MSNSKYRNVHVDGILYKYVVGKSYVKIVGPNENELVERTAISIETYHGELITTPGMIVAYIRGQEINASSFFKECGHAEGKVRLDPYLNEIEQIKIYRLLCDDCYDRIAEDI
jgi:hypothetical protein